MTSFIQIITDVFLFLGSDLAERQGDGGGGGGGGGGNEEDRDVGDVEGGLGIGYLYLSPTCHPSSIPVSSTRTSVDPKDGPPLSTVPPRLPFLRHDYLHKHLM
jgi:hypothetical protein